MRAPTPRRANRALLPLLVAALIAASAPHADALVAGTGRLDAIDFDGAPPTLTFDGTFHWDDASFDVLGTPVNLGASFPGTQAVANGQVTSLDFGDFSASFTVSLQSDSSSGAFLDLNAVTGSAICTQPTCLNATATFLGDVGNVAQSPAVLPLGALVYTVDGSISLDAALQGSGPFGLNAFAPHDTPLGENVFVSSGDDSFYDSLQDEIVGFAAQITFPFVVTPGQTTFRALSTAEGTIPADIVLDGPAFEAVFIDIQTTATFSSSALVCIVVPEDTTVPLHQFRLLHREGPGPSSPDGAFVDITEGTLTSPNRVCGFVTSLSPFVVGRFVPEVGCPNGVIENDEPCDEGPDGGPVEGACGFCTPGCECVGTTTTTIAPTTTTIVTTTTTVAPTTTTIAPTTTTVAPSTTIATTSTSVTFTTTTTSSTSTSSSTTTSTSSTSSTTLPPSCIAAPTFESILCRLDEVIAIVQGSDIPEPTRGNLLRSLTAARNKTAAGESRFDAGRTRGAKGKLKSAARSLNAVLFRLRSLNGSRRIPAELAAELTGLTSPIQADMLTLRGSL
jgi:hypothetical protein